MSQRSTGLTKILLCLVALLIPAVKSAAADFRGRGAANPSGIEASLVFGNQKTAANLASAAVGSYSKGCLAGAEPLPIDGPHWQAMRLSRNRNWGHPELLNYIRRFSTDAAVLEEWPGLLVGDLSQPRGGPMLSGHKSHQIGLDVDIWFRPSPQRRLSLEERENWSAESLVKGPFELNRAAWTEDHARLLRRAASYPGVARIFVHPTIKKALCAWPVKKRSWLAKIRAWYGHDDHFHVRLKCPSGGASCINQEAPPAGDGCGEELAWWLSDDAYRPHPGEKAPQPLTLGDLPAACAQVLESQ